MTDTRQHILDLTRPQLQHWLTDHGHPRFRTDQILGWIYPRRAQTFADMKNLPLALRQQLDEHFLLRAAAVRNAQHAPDGTCKFLLEWCDGQHTESVFLPDKKHRSVCISSQIGCPVGCSFCASGRDGLVRSLHPGEMVEQVLHAADLLAPDDRISHVVVMGMGEPLTNYENVLAALRTLNASWALNIAARHLTLSTIGLPNQIRRLADEPLQLTLAVSLHAPDDSLRRQLIPWAAATSLADLFDAIDDYYAKTHREVTLEYVLLRAINDTPRHAEQLAHWVQRSRCNVNLINYNAVRDSGFEPLPASEAKFFLDYLRRLGVNAHLRKSRGREIDAACGQLRHRHHRPV